MSLFDEIAADAPLLLAELGRPATFRGAPVAILTGDAQVAMDLNTGGFVPTGSKTFKFLYTSFSAAPPKDGEVITCQGVAWRLKGIGRNPNSSWYIAHAEPVA